MDNFLLAFLVGEGFLLSLLLFFHPLETNVKANRWLGLFAFVLGMAFLSNYLESFPAVTVPAAALSFLESLQFLLAPSLFISILFFVHPTEKFKVKYWLHFLPFVVFLAIDFLLFRVDARLAKMTLFNVGENAFWVRDLLPFQLTFYLLYCYGALRRHQKNLRLVTATTKLHDLRWLRFFLLFFIVPIVFWINDALGIAPDLVKFNRIVYAISVLFLAYSALRQPAVFPFAEIDLAEIDDIIKESADEKPSVKRTKRLDSTQIAELSDRLDDLMTNQRLFLDNELTLASLATKLGISIHDASFLINEVTGSNFYNFVNKFRVEEAKRLLSSGEAKRFNMLGIAFESGFNSKTAFYSAFKRFAGVSPAEFSKSLR